MRLVVIGGVAGGMSAAAKAKRTRPDLEVVVFERGPNVSYGACGLPYAIAGEVADFQSLVARTPEQFAAQGVEVRTRHEVASVDYTGREVAVRDLDAGREQRVAFDRLVVATGALPIRPPLDGVDLGNVFVLRSIEDGRAISAAAAEARQAVVVGGGYIGLEMAEALRKRGLHVTVVEMLPQLIANVDPEVAALAGAELERHGVRVMLDTRVLGFSGEGRVRAVVTTAGEVEADLVLLALGVRPNSGLAQEMGLEVGVAGAIRVDERMRASLEGVYAAGDVTEVLHLVSGQPAYIPLGDTANKQGRVAGTNLAGGDAVFRGVVGTAVSKVFDLGVARTGLNLAEAKALGLTAEAVMVRANDHAEYYPDRHSITVRLVYQPEGGRLLGAQIAARGDAVKRIDVVAALLHQGASVADLAALDLAYAPPYSPVWDPLLVAANQVVG